MSSEHQCVNLGNGFDLPESGIGERACMKVQRQADKHKYHRPSLRSQWVISSFFGRDQRNAPEAQDEVMLFVRVFENIQKSFSLPLRALCLHDFFSSFAAGEES